MYSKLMDIKLLLFVTVSTNLFMKFVFTLLQTIASNVNFSNYFRANYSHQVSERQNLETFKWPAEQRSNCHFAFWLRRGKIAGKSTHWGNNTFQWKHQSGNFDTITFCSYCALSDSGHCQKWVFYPFLLWHRQKLAFSFKPQKEGHLKSKK